MSKHSTSQADINSRERMNKALGLRKAGATLDQIASQCGYGSRSSAHKAIRRAMSELPVENAEALRTLEVARLDELMLAWWSKSKFDIGAAYLVLKVIEARCKLLGLNVEPEEIERNVTVVREVPAGFLGPIPIEQENHSNGHTSTRLGSGV